MSNAVDRRPWLILSRRECEALFAACIDHAEMSEDLKRALHQIQIQIEWIDAGTRVASEQAASAQAVHDALVREYTT